MAFKPETFSLIVIYLPLFTTHAFIRYVIGRFVFRRYLDFIQRHIVPLLVEAFIRHARVALGQKLSKVALILA